MKINKKKYHARVIALMLALAMAVTSCLTGNMASMAKKDKVKISSVKFAKPVTSTLALKKGETYSLRVQVQPSKWKKRITFSSSKAGIVSVSKNGRCKAKKTGNAVITLSSISKPKKKAKLKVSVYKKLTKVKKVIMPSAAVLNVGEKKSLKAEISPGKATVKGVVYQSSDTKVASVDRNGTVIAKRAGDTVITALAKDGRGAGASCKITVRASGGEDSNTGTTAPVIKSDAPQASAQISALPSVEPSMEPTERPLVDPDKEDTFVMADGGTAVSVYLDPQGKDFEGLNLVAQSFAKDIDLVSSADVLPAIETDTSKLKGLAVIAGSVGNNALIDELVKEGKMYVDDIEGKWEVYKILVVRNPVPGVERAIVVAGSDKRGTIYGLYHLSEQMGVSPWVYWGDAVPAKKEKIELAKKDFEGTSQEPSVRYRGIFLNDEAPSLTGWVKNTFGNYNEQFYEHVYELILRLKGNYLWPAMWSNSFSDDGKKDKLANAKLADQYGVVMGTSHHEPMCRAGVEWQRNYKKYGSSNEWDFNKNEEAITKFWRDGMRRNMLYENVVTLGMRGEADSSLGGTVEDNIDLLKKVITTQKNILEDEWLEDIPKVLTVYKEVEAFWHGTDQKEGLKTWDALNDVTIMLCDDNFGNMRTLPERELRDRAGGWGMYYHFDYHGGPTSYEWVNSTQLNKVWEQMTMAYEHGIDDIWIVNVGDLKPMEMNISYFLDLAYDYDQWGRNGLNKTTDYTAEWVKQQFGNRITNECKADIVTLLKEYTWLNGSCKPEALSNTTYDASNYNEAREMLGRIERMVNLAKAVQSDIPEELGAAYYQLVYFPAVASGTVAKIQIYSGLNQFYYDKKMSCANLYADLLSKEIGEDKRLEEEYNNNMPGVGAKWKNMMSSPHVGFVTWNSEGWKYPDVKRYQPDDSATMVIGLEGQKNVYTQGNAELGDFTSENRETYTVDISNSGSQSFTYEAKTNADWILLSSTSGSVSTYGSFDISIDWPKVAKDSEGTVTVSGAGKTVTIPVRAKVMDKSGLAEKTYMYENGYASIAAGGFTKSEAGANGEKFEVIYQYGKMGDSVKVFPSDASFTDLSEAPYVEYTVSVPEAGTYKLTTYTAPSSNVDRNVVAIRYAVAVNGEDPEFINSINELKYEAGSYSGTWAADVKANGRQKESEIDLMAGVNTIRYYAVDPAFVLQKAVISKESVKRSHFGPAESYYVGKSVLDVPAWTLEE